MASSGIDAGLEEQRYPRGLRVVDWLRRHRDVVIALTAAGIVVSFLLDLLIPGYAIAGFYLIPLMLVALALQRRAAIALTSALCLALTVSVMVVQGRVTGQNILLVVFGVLAGAGLIALGYLFNRFDRLYERERLTIRRLHSLTDQLQRLQEVSVLDSQRPLSELLSDIVVQARQLLDGDAARLFRLDAAHDALVVQAESGGVDGDDRQIRPAADGALGRAVAVRRPLAEGTCLAVPLVVRDDVYGVIELSYPQRPTAGDEDLWLAAAFADQAALAIENARLREQVERTAVAAERSRLARELHDSVTQSLFAASLNAESLLQERGALTSHARASLEDLELLTRGALAEMRSLLLEMRPAALAQASLADLLEHLARAASARTGTPIELVQADACALPPDVTLALYRIAQEATANVVRHAGAKRAWVSLTAADDGVTLVVGDDGCGFAQGAVGPEQFGLRNMRERAEAVGAEFAVESEAGHGTVVTVEWRVAGVNA